MVYAVYYRWSHDVKWVLARQFRVPQHAVALILDMIAAAIRRGFDLGTLEIIRIDLQVPPYGKAPEFLTEVEPGLQAGNKTLAQSASALSVREVAVSRGRVGMA